MFGERNKIHTQRQSAKWPIKIGFGEVGETLVICTRYIFLLTVLSLAVSLSVLGYLGVFR